MCFITYFQDIEETNDEIYLKIHNLFEKKEIEFRNRIKEKFKKKKEIKNEKIDNNKNNKNCNELNNKNTGNDFNFIKNGNSSIIKIILND